MKNIYKCKILLLPKTNLISICKKVSLFFFLILLFDINFTYSGTIENNRKREYAEFIVDDQKEAINVCWYYTKLLQRNTNTFLNTYKGILPDTTIRTIQNILGEYTDEIWHYEKEYKELIVNIYMDYYTTSELRELKKFYLSPLGAKLNQVQIDINKTIYKQTDQVTTEIIKNLTKKLEPYLKEKEIESLLIPETI